MRQVICPQRVTPFEGWHFVLCETPLRDLWLPSD